MILHASTLFQCIFPLFGKILIHREAILYISGAVFILAFLTYGAYKRYVLAFYSLIVYYGLFLLSVLLTFSKYSFTDLISLLDLPAYEQNHLVFLISGILNFNLTAFLGSFLFIALLSVIYSHKYFHKSRL
jgi:hypothetical protein